MVGHENNNLLRDEDASTRRVNALGIEATSVVARRRTTEDAILAGTHGQRIRSRNRRHHAAITVVLEGLSGGHGHLTGLGGHVHVADLSGHAHVTDLGGQSGRSKVVAGLLARGTRSLDRRRRENITARLLAQLERGRPARSQSQRKPLANIGRGWADLLGSVAGVTRRNARGDAQMAELLVDRGEAWPGQYSEQQTNSSRCMRAREPLTGGRGQATRHRWQRKGGRQLQKHCQRLRTEYESRRRRTRVGFWTTHHDASSPTTATVIDRQRPQTRALDCRPAVGGEPIELFCNQNRRMQQEKVVVDEREKNPRQQKKKQTTEESRSLTILGIGIRTRIGAAAQAEGAGAMILASGAAGLVGSKHGGHCRCSE